MDLEEAVSDLFDSGVKDNTLALLYDANRDIKVRVKTPSGLGVEKHLKNSCTPRRHMGPDHGF